MAGKRKSSHNHFSSHKNNDQSRSHDHQQKRRKSEEVDEHGDIARQDDEGWQTVQSKRRRAQQRDQGDEVSQNDTKPALKVHQNYQGVVHLKNVRELALYALADELAPNWLAVRNAKSIKKVVTLMIPGLDRDLLQNVLPDSRGKSAEIPAPGSDSTAQFLKRSDRMKWLWEGYHQVKAPGDSKLNRVHSPLQAMLLCQNSKPSNKTTSENDSASERTSIINLVHSGEELREAEYPVHPAAFSAMADAGLESERRSKTGQDAAGGWVDSQITVTQPIIMSDSKDWLSKGLTIYSLDCEMVQTSDDVYSLARISLIEYPHGKVVIDKYVKPDLPITNYHTQYSGITPQILEDVTTTLRDIQQELLRLLTPSTILLGHSLDSDLNALKLTHPFVVDTSIVFPHPRGLPLRSSLKYLANKYLKREIQMGGQNGHNSVEDAKAVLDLIKLKCEKGLAYGTMEANGEPIFRLLTRNGRTSTMVEYGTPERGYGKDATHTIGCQNDQDVVKGVLRAVKGDDYFEFEIPAGGDDFVWARLRALEFARGWVTGANSQAQATTGVDATQAETGRSDKESDPQIDSLVPLAETVLEHIQQVYEALPEDTLLVLISGTGDMRSVMKLQAQQQQYRKDFKVKKWDELTVKWTDTEEQALRRACEDARAGWAICTIK